LLAAGCALLAAGCWLLAAGCWLLAAGCSASDALMRFPYFLSALDCSYDDVRSA